MKVTKENLAQILIQAAQANAGSISGEAVRNILVKFQGGFEVDENNKHYIQDYIPSMGKNAGQTMHMCIIRFEVNNEPLNIPVSKPKSMTLEKFKEWMASFEAGENPNSQSFAILGGADQELRFTLTGATREVRKFT